MILKFCHLKETLVNVGDSTSNISSSAHGSSEQADSQKQSKTCWVYSICSRCACNCNLLHSDLWIHWYLRYSLVCAIPPRQGESNCSLEMKCSAEYSYNLDHNHHCYQYHHYGHQYCYVYVYGYISVYLFIVPYWYLILASLSSSLQRCECLLYKSCDVLSKLQKFSKYADVNVLLVIVMQRMCLWQFHLTCFSLDTIST